MKKQPVPANVYILSTKKSKKVVSKKISKDVDKVIKEYLDTVIKEDLPIKEHTLPVDIQMRLTVDDIKAKKELFNALFKKHGIDYTV